jgi:hypothetical protein
VVLSPLGIDAKIDEKYQNEMKMYNISYNRLIICLPPLWTTACGAIVAALIWPMLPHLLSDVYDLYKGLLSQP